MLIAPVTIMLLGGSNASSVERFILELDKYVSKELKDSAARVQAQAAVEEMKSTFGDYDARLKQIPQELAAKNAAYAISDGDFEQALVVVADARSATFERLVASREKLRQAISADQWDATVGAASRK